MPTAFIGDDLPMTRVSWFDGMAFCAWLSVQLDIRSFDIRNIASWSVRLPTEQEWQRAATGDTDWKYPWGNEFKDGYGNYANQVGLQPSKVGSYPEGASPFGVMDMIGNLWEWCITPWGSDEMNVSGYTYRVFKGGAWNISNPEYLSATDRWSHSPRGRLNDCGIRVMFVVQNGQ
jgi:formylglycine-generating enzyme required for sulfatase activity